MALLGELNVRGAEPVAGVLKSQRCLVRFRRGMCDSPDTLNLELGQGDEVGLLAALGQLHAQDAVADLLDLQRATAEARLLGRVAIEDNVGARHVECGDGRVVRDLLGLEANLAVVPSSDELLAEEGVERLLLRARLLLASGELAREGGNVPLGDE